MAALPADVYDPVARIPLRREQAAQYFESLLRDTPTVDIHTFRGGKVVRFRVVYDTLGFARALGAV